MRKYPGRFKMHEIDNIGSLEPYTGDTRGYLVVVLFHCDKC